MGNFIKSHRFLLVVFTMGLALGFLVGRRNIPFFQKKTQWTIGIIEDSSPFDAGSTHVDIEPVLTAEDVNDIKAGFVADPFMIVEGPAFFMFFEVLNAETKQGDIGLATSNDGKHWKYGQIVIDEPFHMSYPYVFEWQDAFYMVPESHQDSSIRLYRSDKFPTEWHFVCFLLKGYDFVDNTLFQFDGKWWMFTSSVKGDVLRLFYSDHLTGPWTEHPQSPIVTKNNRTARPGGRVIVYNQRLFRFAQDGYPEYGSAVNAFEIVELNSTSYKERPYDKNPVLTPGNKSWNKTGMHHIDPHQIDKTKWISCVDGKSKKYVFGLAY